jgi:hypothetical protein
MSELEIIDLLNTKAYLIQEHERNNFNKGVLPVIPPLFIVGCPRSGTTILSQYLANTGTWVFPTNLLTKFAKTTYLGSLVQSLFCLNQNKSEQNISFHSTYGRSENLMDINEFLHFFRQFFPNHDIRHLDNEELEKVNLSDLEKDIQLISSLYNKPFLSKNMMMQYNLDYFNSKMSPAIYLYIKRNPDSVAKSIYKARLDEHGDENIWWSAKPKEYEQLKKLSVRDQIAGQIKYTNKAIEQGLSKVPDKYKLQITYEEFIANPYEIYMEILFKYKTLGYELLKAKDSELVTLRR